MDIKKEYGTDVKKETDGIWKDFGDGLECLIARSNNSNYQKEFTRLSKPHRKAIRRGTLNDDVAEQILVKAMAKAILLNWKGMKEGGIEIPYSEKEAVRILTEYKDFRQDVMEIADDINQYKIEEDADAEKN